MVVTLNCLLDEFQLIGHLIRGINTTVITRENWGEIENIRESVIYNCTPVDITSKIHPSNDFINLVSTRTRKDNTDLQRQNNLNYIHIWSFHYERRVYYTKLKRRFCNNTKT